MNRKSIILLLTGLLLAGIVLTVYQPVAAAEVTPTTAVSKKALLVVSFGTSYADTRAKTIEASEKALAAALPDYDLKRAFTSQTIIDILKERDNIEVDNVAQAIEKIYKDGYTEVLVQPLHVINGEEYHSLIAELIPYQEKFASFNIGSPLLSSHEDYVAAIEALEAEMPARGEKEAVVFMGHGTHHPADAAYAAMNYVLQDEGYTDVFVGTVEGYPTLDTIIKSLEAAKIEKVTLMPFMIVAGDHAQNDMAGDEDGSWKVILKSKGYEVETVLKGLGEMEGIQKIYIEHAKAALEPAGEEEAAE
jgi:sirohydrochlorin cobaltochelatase